MEPLSEPRDAAYFRSLGFFVNERPYGTRVYAEMFTIEGSDYQPFLEVRRAPLSSGSAGIHAANECHVRLCNRTCYFDNAALLLVDFLATHGYEFQRISRCDICLDFEYFDTGDEPAKFLKRYLAGRYHKINQCHVSSHGEERWDTIDWHSISWGSSSSDIGTKFYDKTAELYDPHTKQYKKPYIRQAWALCGLVDDWNKCTKTAPDGTIYTPRIWRVEFSIRSSVKRWFRIELNGKERGYQSIRNTLACYTSRELLLTMFASLAHHYFHFKKYVAGQRKDRCPDKQLFNFAAEQVLYKIDKGEMLAAAPTRNEFRTLAYKLRSFRIQHCDEEIRHATDVILKCLDDEAYTYDLKNPFSRRELEALRWVMGQKSRGRTEDTAVLLKEFRAFLHLRPEVAPF